MVFLRKSAQMRDSAALHLTLDELLRAITEARTSLVILEKGSDERSEELSNEFVFIAADELFDDASATALTFVGGIFSKQSEQRLRYW